MCKCSLSALHDNPALSRLYVLHKNGRHGQFFQLKVIFQSQIDDVWNIVAQLL